MASSPRKLVYFDLRGRGELIRFILKVAGADFVEETVDLKEWPKLKETTQSPNKKLPYMEIDGKLYSESIPLVRFLAKQYGLSGTDEHESLSADMYVAMIEDVRSMMYFYMLSPLLTEDVRAAIKDNLIKEKCPALYDFMEKALIASTSGFLVGENLTFADLSLADFNDQVEKTAPGFHDNYPKVKEHWERVKALPKLADYLAKRRDVWV